ncbi:MAG: P63C domain-containing protein [Hydrogenophaga sp.]|nr:P63C domain-containing protein [Hydrogenophaga sp.]
MSEEKKELTGRAKGGAVVAAKMTPEQKAERARKGAMARWGAKLPKATHKGSFKEELGIDAECYVLDDDKKTAVITQLGMGEILGLGSGGSRLPRFVFNKTMSEYLGPELTEKIKNPVIFHIVSAGQGGSSLIKANGYDASILIDICRAILQAKADGKNINPAVVAQAGVIVGASAKAGIRGLVYALAGYRPEVEEVIQAFKVYVQDEAKKYEAEFPNELYMQWHRLYEIPVLERGRSWHMKHLTVRHIYYPLAQSNGKILELLRALKESGGERNKKLFQFLNDVGARALRMHIGRVLEMTESASSKQEYEKKIIDRFGGQPDLPGIEPA